MLVLIVLIEHILVIEWLEKKQVHARNVMFLTIKTNLFAYLIFVFWMKYHMQRTYLVAK